MQLRPLLLQIATRLLLLLLFSAAAPPLVRSEIESVAAVRLPPIITRQPPRLLVTAPGEPVRLNCEAAGAAPLTFQWHRNGAPLGRAKKATARPADNNTASENGALLLTSPTAKDEGVYQCHARNSLGTAVSVKTDLRIASLDPFPLKREASIERAEGESLRLPCDPPPSYPAASVLWHRFDDGVSGRMSTPPVSNRVAIDPGDGSLLFANLLPSDGNARYQCGARNDVVRRTVEGRAYRLLVRPASPEHPLAQRPPRLMSQSQRSLRLLVNQSADLFCFFSGRPTPEIRWTRGGGAPLSLPSDNRRARPHFRLLESNTRLQLLSLRADRHAGGYACLGENGVQTHGPDGLAAGGFNVEVASEPTWIERPADAVVAEGASHAFMCRASGADGPPVWLVNGRPAEADPRAKLSGQRLVFANLSRADSLVAQCNCSNRHGYAFASAYLRVVSEPPVVTRSPGRLVASVGSDLRVPCGYFAAPEPKVVWSRDGQPVPIGGPAVRHEIQPNGDLLIRQLAVEDSGSYSCVLSNRFGSASAVGSLTVRQPTRITEASADVQTTEGRPVRLICRADTDAAERHRLKVSWLLDGRLLASAAPTSVEEEVGRTELSIASATPADSGVYVCVAANGLDSDKRGVSVRILGRPGAPPGPPSVTCDPHIGASVARLTWPPAPDNNSPLLRYAVEFSCQYSPQGIWQPAEVTSDEAAAATRANVRLRPGIAYEFRVRGINAIGEGVASEAVSAGAACRLPPGRPERHPDGLQIQGTAQRSLLISWKPLSPLEYGADGLEYSVRVSCIDCSAKNADYNETIVTDPTQSRLQLNGLSIGGATRPIETYRRYLAEIRARNSIGEAATGLPLQRATGRSGEEPPKVAPDDFRISAGRGDDEALTWNSVWLAWTLDRDPVWDPRVRGFYRGFRVNWCPSINGTDLSGGCAGQKRFQDFVFRSEAEAEAESALVEPQGAPADRNQPKQFEGRLNHLPGDSSIRAWVHVVNRRHTGPPSAPLDFRTPEGTPGQVGEFVLSLTGVSHLEFYWSPSPQPNGRITGYQLAYREISGLQMGPLVAAPLIADPSQHLGTLTGLSPNTNYRVFIYARTSKGNGEATFLDARTAPPNAAAGHPSNGGGSGILPTAVAATASPVGDQALNISLTPSATGVRAFYVQYRLLSGDGSGGNVRWMETKGEISRRWLLIDNLLRDAWYEVRVVVANGAAAAVYMESLRVRTGGGDASGDVWGGLLRGGSGAAWLACAGLLVLALLTVTADAFYCMAQRKRGHAGRAGDYHRGKPVVTATSPDDAIASLQEGNCCEDCDGVTQHCPHKPPPGATKSYAFGDAGYLTMSCCEEKLPPPQLSAGYSTIAAPAAVNTCTIRGPQAIQVSEYSRRQTGAAGTLGPVVWQTRGSNGNGQQATSVI